MWHRSKFFSLWWLIFIAFFLIELNYTSTMVSTLIKISYLKRTYERRLTKSKLQHCVVVDVVDVVVLQDLTDCVVALLVAAGLTVLLWLVLCWFIPLSSWSCAPPSSSSDNTTTITAILACTSSNVILQFYIFLKPHQTARKHQKSL